MRLGVIDRQGFTLIELSVVLVIIGLITGGILVGRTLISGSEIRAQITQISKYNSAVNAFKDTYGGLPGDLPPNLAAQFSFAVGSGCTGQQGGRDGNGLIDGYLSSAVMAQAIGETGLFWQDLSTIGLIDGAFPNGGAAAITCNTTLILSLTPGTLYVGDYFPVGKIGHGSFLYVYETSGANWYGLSAVTAVASSGTLFSGATIPVIQSYNMDKKTDDGLPTTGSVQATYINSLQTAVQPAPNAPSDSATTCYNTTSNTYSTTAIVNYGWIPNCALSFKFQ